MAQNKIKTLRKLSLDEVNSIEFISGRDLKKTVMADDKAMTERQHTILDKHNGTVIVKTKSATHQISRSNEIRDVIDVKKLRELDETLYQECVRKIEYRKINIKTIKQ
jgi:hypothetical protein